MIATKELYEEKLEYENGKKIVIYVSSFENREACVAKVNSVKQSNIEKLKAKIKRENTKTAREEYKKREAKHENILKALFENIDLPTSKYKYEYLIDFFMFTHQFFRNSNKTYLQKTDIIDKCKTCYGSKTNFRSYVQELFKSDGNGIPTLENGEYSIKSNQISIYYLTPYYLQKDKTMLKTFNDVRLRFQSIKQQNGKTAIQAFNMANKGSVENDSPQMLYATKPNFPDISFFKHNDFIFQDETSSKNYFDIIYKKEKAQENIKEYLKTYSITLNNNNLKIRPNGQGIIHFLKQTKDINFVDVNDKIKIVNNNVEIMIENIDKCALVNEDASDKIYFYNTPQGLFIFPIKGEENFRFLGKKRIKIV